MYDSGPTAEEGGSGYGKQRAQKGIKFVSFPPILTIQLKRFVFDMTTFETIKLNSSFEFPDVLDLTEFLPTEAERA